MLKNPTPASTPARLLRLKRPGIIKLAYRPQRPELVSDLHPQWNPSKSDIRQEETKMATPVKKTKAPGKVKLETKPLPKVQPLMIRG